MNESLRPTEAIKVGWEKMKKNFWFFVVLLIIIWLIQAVPAAISSVLKEKMFALYILVTLAAWVIQIIVNIGLIKITLDIFDKGSGDFKDLFSGVQMLGNFILGSLLYSLIIIGGLLLFIIPGIIWGIKYQFFAYLIVDKKLGPVEALKKSGEITKGNKGNLFLLGLLSMLINFGGMLLLVVGLLATIPTTMMAMVYAYRKLMGEVLTAETPAPAEQAPLPTVQA